MKKKSIEQRIVDRNNNPIMRNLRILRSAAERGIEPAASFENHCGMSQGELTIFYDHYSGDIRTPEAEGYRNYAVAIVSYDARAQDNNIATIFWRHVRHNKNSDRPTPVNVDYKIKRVQRLSGEGPEFGHCSADGTLSKTLEMYFRPVPEEKNAHPVDEAQE